MLCRNPHVFALVGPGGGDSCDDLIPLGVLIMDGLLPIGDCISEIVEEKLDNLYSVQQIKGHAMCC
jgi:hypothetical protein